MSKKKATSSDVAKRAGVSQATVSMVLNKKYNVSFSRETVEKVEQAARELGYHLPGRKNRKESRKEKLWKSTVSTICSSTDAYLLLYWYFLSCNAIRTEYALHPVLKTGFLLRIKVFCPLQSV